jgi:hypothetical protein
VIDEMCIKGTLLIESNDTAWLTPDPYQGIGTDPIALTQAIDDEGNPSSDPFREAAHFLVSRCTFAKGIRTRVVVWGILDAETALAKDAVRIMRCPIVVA